MLNSVFPIWREKGDLLSKQFDTPMGYKTTCACFQDFRKRFLDHIPQEIVDTDKTLYEYTLG